MATVVDAARKGISIVVGAATGGGANAGWFGDGRDGELFVADGETLALDVALDEGQIVKQYTSGYIGTGSLLTAANRCNGMVLLFTGDLTIKGTISMDKKAPLANPMEDQCAAEVHVALCGGLTGGKGGTAGTGQGFRKYYGSETDKNTDSFAIGAPGQGGLGFAFGGGYGGGSGNVQYSYNALAGGSSVERPPVGTTIPYKQTAEEVDAGIAGIYGCGAGAKTGNGAKIGGAGPGGAGAIGSYSWGVAGTAGDAIGGGAIFIFAKGRVVIEGTGVITADGGDGGNGVKNTNNYANSSYGYVDAAAGAGAGAAGGGIIAIIHTGDFTNEGSVAARGGFGGASATATESTKNITATSTAGADGEIGTVLITTLADLLAK